MMRTCSDSARGVALDSCAKRKLRRCSWYVLDVVFAIYWDVGHGGAEEVLLPLRTLRTPS